MTHTRLDWIKSLDLEDMTDFLQANSACDCCICDLDEHSCEAIGCEEGIRRWLNEAIELDCEECPHCYEVDFFSDCYQVQENIKLRKKLREIEELCKFTLSIMNIDSGKNSYACGRCIEAEAVLKIIEVNKC